MAIRMHPPKQPDLVQRHLMTMQWHICASPEYLKQSGVPQRPEDLDAHKLILFGNTIRRLPTSTGWRRRDGGPAIRGVRCWR